MLLQGKQIFENSSVQAVAAARESAAFFRAKPAALSRADATGEKTRPMRLQLPALSP